MSRLITLEQIVNRTTDLPTMPAAALRVMREAENPDATASTIAKLLATDQALSVKVLRLANSSFYGLPRKVRDLSEAVVVLGMRTVKNLAMVASTYPWMNKPLPGYGLGPSELWTNSFATAVGAQEVARLTRKAPDDVAFTAGLLHDLGKVALSIWLENKLQAIFHYAKRENIGFDEAERKVLGYDHTEVGEHLGHSWNLPEEICTVIRYHHHPSQSPESQAIVDCVHVGNWLALTMGFGVGGDGLLYEFDESSLFRLGINVNSLDEITDSFVTGFEQYEKLFKETAA